MTAAQREERIAEELARMNESPIYRGYSEKWKMEAAESYVAHAALTRAEREAAYFAKQREYEVWTGTQAGLQWMHG